MRFSFTVVACLGLGVLTVAAWHAVARPATAFDRVIEENADRMIADGRQTFRFDTFAGNRLVQLQCIAPERLVAERVEAESLPPVGDHTVGILSASTRSATRRSGA